MRKPEPRLQRKLLAWLLGPLALLLVLDTAVAYWNSVRFSDLAYDRALYELGREIALHVKTDALGARLDMSDAASNVLLQDPDDLIFYRVFAGDGQSLGGNASMAPLPANGNATPRFFGSA